MILIALGSNLPSPRFGPPQAVLEAALFALSKKEVKVCRRSGWYRSAPQPRLDQPWYVNGVAEIETGLAPPALLALLHEIEADFGRVRKARNEARVLDLDLIAYHDFVSAPGEVPRIPHPRLAERAFVVLPIAEMAPDWRHPVTGLTADELSAQLPPDQEIERLPGP